MPDGVTPKLGMLLPEIGSSRDTWGTKLNNNFLLLDARLFGVMPIGARIGFCGPSPPPGWLMCDGSAVSRATYPELFAVLGTHYGAGDGSTTFNLPNYNGKVPMGLGSYADANSWNYNITRGQVIGSYSVVLTAANLPSGGLAVTVPAVAAYGGTDGQGTHSHSAWTDTQGDHAHWSVGTLVWARSTGGGHRSLWYGDSPVYEERDLGNIMQTTGAHGHNVGIADSGYHGHNVSVTVPAQTVGVYGGGNAGFGVAQPSIGEMQIIFSGRIPPSVAAADPL